jgi:hypothetical protein
MTLKYPFTMDAPILDYYIVVDMWYIVEASVLFVLMYFYTYFCSSTQTFGAQAQ